MIDENVLATRISAHEAGAKEVNIAQIKEILKITLDLLSQEQPGDIVELLEKHKEKE